MSQRAASWLKELELTPAALVERLGTAGEPAPLALRCESRLLWVTAAGTNRKGSISLILETLPAPLCLLTPREAEAHSWVCRGKSNEQIAELMGIEVCTVRKHLQRLYDKFGVDGRAGAASYGALLSLARVPD